MLMLMNVPLRASQQDYLLVAVSMLIPQASFTNTGVNQLFTGSGLYLQQLKLLHLEGTKFAVLLMF